MITEAVYEGKTDATVESSNLLIIGRSGNGLKSVMRSILQSTKNAFQVIDCTGIDDPDEGMTAHQYLSVKRNYYSQKYEQLKNVNAVVFVLKYGVRFTKQEKDAVKIVKDLFGGDVFQKKVVIIFTYGDLFYKDIEDKDEKAYDPCRLKSDECNTLSQELLHGQVLNEKKILIEQSGSEERCDNQAGPSGQKSDGLPDKDRHTFITWCQSQTGDIKTLFQEVSFRCVLFDSKTKDETRKLYQLQQFTKCFRLVKDEHFKGVAGVETNTNSKRIATKSLMDRIYIDVDKLRLLSKHRNVRNCIYLVHHCLEFLSYLSS